MMRKIALCMAMVMLLAGAALAEDGSLGEFFTLDGEAGYTAQYDEANKWYAIAGEGVTFYAQPRGYAEMGYDADAIAASFTDSLAAEILAQATEGSNVLSTVFRVNNIYWIEFQVVTEDFIRMAAVGCSEKGVLTLVDSASATFDALESLIDAIWPADIAVGSSDAATWRKTVRIQNNGYDVTYDADLGGYSIVKGDEQMVLTITDLAAIIGVDREALYAEYGEQVDTALLGVAAQAYTAEGDIYTQNGIAWLRCLVSSGESTVRCLIGCADCNMLVLVDMTGKDDYSGMEAFSACLHAIEE